MKPRSGSTSRSGFTLVELLVVVAVIVVLTSLAIPAVSGMRRATDVTKASYDIMNLLTQAKAYAMASNTYVYVGFSEANEAQSPSAVPEVSGTGRIIVSVVATRDGTRGYDPTNISVSWANNYNNGANLVAISKVLVFDDMHLAQNLGVPSNGVGPMARPAVGGNARVGMLGSPPQPYQVDTPFSWPLGSPLNASSCQYYFDRVIVYDPQGVPRILLYSTEDTNEYLEVDLQQTNGNLAPGQPADPNVGNQIALVINGITGNVVMYQP